MDDRIRLLSLVPLSALGSYLAGLGLADLWHSRAGVEPHVLPCFIVAASLRSAWLFPMFGSGSAAVAATWLVSVTFVRDGLAASGFTSAALAYALLLDGITFAVARSGAGRPSWSAHLARWRRSRQRIHAELRMSEGLLPWTRACLVQLLTGCARRPAAGAFERWLTELADLGDRVPADVAALALPAAVEQTLLTAVQTVIARAEAAAAEASALVERQALEEAAACRDAIDALEDVTRSERDRLADVCESRILGLVHRVGPPLGGAPTRQTASEAIGGAA